MSELLPPRSTSGFGDPALVFPEFASKQCVLEKVTEEEGEGEDSNYGKGSFDLSSRFSSPSVFQHDFEVVDIPSKRLPSGFRDSPYKLSRFQEEEDDERDHNNNSGFFIDHIDEEEKREYSGCYRKCCALTCMFLSIVLIIVLLIGLSVNSSINSKLPHVFVTNIKFSRLDFVKSSADLLMNANMNTVLQLSNKNDKTSLYYSPTRVEVSSENINLGQKRLIGFQQNPGNVTFLKIATRVRKFKVYDVDATLLRNKEKNFEVVVDVLLREKLSFYWLGFKIHLPIVIACEDIKQSDAINGLKPECDVRFFSQ